jgi:hypothetical protein
VTCSPLSWILLRGKDVRRKVLSMVAATCVLMCISNLVARIALVRPSLSKQIESLLVRLAQSGQLRGRVTEQQLIGLLEQVNSDALSLTCIFQR